MVWKRPQTLQNNLCNPFAWASKGLKRCLLFMLLCCALLFIICMPVFQRTLIHLVHSATRSTLLPQRSIPLVSENSHDPLAIASPECPDPQVLPKATSESELEQKETEEIASLGPLYSLTEEKQTRFFQIKEHQYERRRDHLNKYCHTIRHMYDPGMKSPMMSMKDQCILYDKKDGISHCSIAKVASTTWCRHFINLAGVNPKNVIEQFFVKHLWPLPTDVPVEEAIAETLSFVIIRNPLSRLASVYFEKFVDARISLKLIQSIIDLGNRERPKKPNFDQTYEFPEDDPYFPSPIEFLYFVAEDFKKVVKEDIDYHWRPQHGSCPFCRFNFTMYAKMENLQEDTAYLLQKANLTAKIKPDRHENLSRSGGIGSSKDHRFWSRVPGSIIKKMYDLYLLDSVLWGYSLEDYLKALNLEAKLNGVQ